VRVYTRAWCGVWVLVCVALAASCSNDGAAPSLDFVGVEGPGVPDLTTGGGLSCASDADCAGGVAPGCGVASCGPEGRCVFEPAADGSACDDGNACTTGDVCGAGRCVPGANACECETDADCSEYDDVDKCNGSFRCTATGCAPDPDSVVVCDAGGGGDGCRSSTCEPATGACVERVAPDGSACDDLDACTAGEHCEAGACTGGAAVGCPAAPQCSVALCRPATGCAIEPLADGAACVDDDPCTSGERCSAGVCGGGSGRCACVVDGDCAAFDVDRCDGALRCADGVCVDDGAKAVVCPPSPNPCRPLACVPSTGECVAGLAPDGTACGAAGTCAEGATCQAGACVPPAAACDDGNPCTADLCDLVKGCVNVPAAGPCDDGDDCTGADTCAGGVCAGQPIACACAVDADCAGSAFDPCKGDWQCKAGKCALTAGTAVVCPPAGPCAASVCDPATGTCGVAPSPNGAPCDDGQPCTVGEACAAGACGGGQALECDDNNPCTNDVCQAGVGCVHSHNAAPCDDANACTKGDSCQVGTCKPGAAVACPAGGPCTVGTCDAQDGCEVQPAPTGSVCDDSNACTVGETCQAGACVGPNVCDCVEDADCEDDGDLCNGVPRCVGGACAVEPVTVVTCPAGGDCVTVGCEPNTGACVVAPVPDGKACFDGGSCKGQGVCAAGACDAPAADCDDKNPCTVDACQPQSGTCAHTPINGAVCNDGEPCTTGDACALGACVGGGALPCDDSDACTKDLCVPGQGCQFVTAAAGDCADGDPCTVDACQPEIGCVHTPKDCGGSLAGPCEAAACDSTGACVIVASADGAPCTDDDPCTTGDACLAGACAGAGIVCDDGDSCTSDACAAGTCAFEQTPGAACDDGDACTVEDRCAAAGCVGTAIACDDGDACTTDTCEAGTCLHAKIALCGVGVPCNGSAGSSCNDGDSDTVADVCIEQVCLGFTRTTVSGAVATATALRGVDYAAGRWFVIIDNGIPVVGNGGGLGLLNEDGSVTTAAETKSASTFQALRGGFASDSAGRLWRFEPAVGGGKWTSDGPASKSYAALGSLKATTLWATADVGSGQGILLWAAGAVSVDPIRRCTAAQGAGVVCAAESEALSSGTLPRAFAGRPCVGQACQAPDLSLTADLPNGSDGGVPQFYNDVFAREPNQDPLWDFSYQDQGDGPSVTRDATALADGRKLVVGTRGYLRDRDEGGDWGGQFTVKSSDSRNFEGAWSGGGVVALAAWRTGSGSSRVFELWLARTTGNLDSAGSWNVVELGTESGDASVVYDVWGTPAGSIRVVATRAASFGLNEGVVYSRLVD
jgi:hypothetical protein